MNNSLKKKSSSQTSLVRGNSWFNKAATSILSLLTLYSPLIIQQLISGFFLFCFINYPILLSPHSPLIIMDKTYRFLSVILPSQRSPSPSASRNAPPPRYHLHPSPEALTTLFVRQPPWKARLQASSNYVTMFSVYVLGTVMSIKHKKRYCLKFPQQWETEHHPLVSFKK